MVPQKVIWRPLRIETEKVDTGQSSPLFSHYNKYFLCSHFFIISKNLWSSVYKCFDGSKLFFMTSNIISPKNGHWELLALLSKILAVFFFWNYQHRNQQFWIFLLWLTLCKKCPHSELFWFAFSCIRTK